MKLKQNKQSKLVVALSAVILLLVALSATLTFAYFTAKDSQTSGAITFGKLYVELGNSAKVEADHSPVVPGCTINVTGTSAALLADSTIEAFVRLKLSIEGLTETTDYTVEGLDSNTWVAKGEGSNKYYYYVGQGVTDKHIGIANASTNNFGLNSIVINIKKSLDNTFQGKTATVTLTVEAIQADHTVKFENSDTTADATATKIATATDAWAAAKTQANAN